MHYDIIVIGAGAAGYFSAINIAEKNPTLKICILEKNDTPLSKVKVSGGGRCNFTNICSDPKELVKYYPRGNKELLGAFYKFSSKHTLEWFQNRGVEFYVAEDGSIFPKSDDSQTIIDCFINAAKNNNIDVFNNNEVVKIHANNIGKSIDEAVWSVHSVKKEFTCEKLIITTGSNKNMWKVIEHLNHDIIKPVPSLFTFKIKDSRIDGLMGLVVENVTVSIKNSKIKPQKGALLITHWGMSGPAILKLSAFGAREMNESSYQNSIYINWTNKYNTDTAYNELMSIKSINAKKKVVNDAKFDIPSRLWKNLVDRVGISVNKNWGDVNKILLKNLASELTQSEFVTNGKAKFKEEFVTAGGVNLKEINFNFFESKLHKNLFFAGEVLNIDAITGGFNFQNAWTGAWIISESIE